MSWLEIGAIGELIGALGLFVSWRNEAKMKKAREYESLTLKTIELNLAAAQSSSSSMATKWWQYTDGMWGEVQNSPRRKLTKFSVLRKRPLEALLVQHDGLA